ncbi:MAG: NAD(P)H-dependent oxidoreductase subunit E [Firmicutes bacterium]|nr:NAD(P)H-dependent oxidoreductase subunit E [Bacillota bacterium]
MAASSCRAASGGCAGKYRKLDEILQKYKGVPGALIPVLHQAQLLFGYLPHDVQVRIAEELDLPLSEVYGVSSFYSFFSLKPRGKYTVSVCMGTACYVKGAPALLEKIKETLRIEDGETTEDGLFTLDTTRCVGACGLAPVLTIGDDVYGRLTPEKVPEILERYRR